MFDILALLMDLMAVMMLSLIQELESMDLSGSEARHSKKVES